VGTRLNYVILENVDAQGNTRAGNNLVIVNDGSGQLATSLFNSLSVAIEAVRPIGTTFSIQPPSIIQVQLSLSVQCPTELSIPAVQGLLQTTIENYVNTHTIGSTLSITRISQLVYFTEPEVINVSTVLLNGEGVDLVAPPAGAFQFLGISFT
jgi:hypothetical protein